MLEYLGFGFTQRFGAEKNMTDYSLVVLLLKKKKGTVRAKAVEMMQMLLRDLTCLHLKSAQHRLHCHIFLIYAKRSTNVSLASFIYFLPKCISKPLPISLLLKQRS